MIILDDIRVRIGSKLLLDHASAHISDSQKVGIIGPNGCGKSTLFKVIRGELETETGSVFFPEHCRVAHVAQSIDDINAGVLDFVLARDEERSRLLQAAAAADAGQLAEIHERLKVIEADSAPARASAILSGLGFSESDLSRPVREFSGGWRMRLALAAALFQPSDVLLLDEPTNHLDLETSLWLENHLRRYKGTLLLISHDRSILNSLCDYIINFDNKHLVTYSGNYDTFLRTRNEQKEVRERQFRKQEQYRKHLESFVERFRYKATKAKQAQSRLKMLAKLPPVELLDDEASAHFDFPQAQIIPSPLLSLENVSVGYDGKAVLRRLSLNISADDRIAMLGANGNGKSTLAKLLSFRLPSMEGNFHRSPKLKVGYFAQHQAEELPLDLTPLEFLTPLMPEKNETRIRSHLARFGLQQEKSLTRIALLSGGEKARLLFAVMTINAPELLILDEPTNHLDMAARDALVEALNEYNGAVILITHDLHLIELVADTLWLVNGGTCKPYDGDLDDYRRLLLEPKTPKVEIKRRQEEEQRKQQAKAEVVAQKARQKENQQQLRRIEKEINKLNDLRQELENRFQEVLPPDEIIRLQKEINRLNREIENLEETWLSLAE